MSALQTRTPWAIALHGGAGAIAKGTEESEVEAYEAALTRVLLHGAGRLAAGVASLAVAVEVVSLLEDCPLFNAGHGAVRNELGLHELEACVMDGVNLRSGAVAGLTRVRNPIELARHVMTDSPHAFLIGAGAEAFAVRRGLTMVENSWFSTPRRLEQLELLRREGASRFQDPEVSLSGEGGSVGSGGSTVGCVVRDTRGDLVAATSTGGLTGKWAGRVGDTPFVGAGTYASNMSCAVSGTGIGEAFMRSLACREVAALMEHHGMSLQAAVERVLLHNLKPGDGGLIAVSATGPVVMEMNTPGMYRACAHEAGVAAVGIWTQMKPILMEGAAASAEMDRA